MLLDWLVEGYFDALLGVEYSFEDVESELLWEA
jgi:hypothetical protein